MPQNCSVMNCSNSNKNGFSMVGFPKNAKRREEWTTAIGRKPWAPRNNDRICEVHFKSLDWLGSKKRKYLKSCALPKRNDSCQAVLSPRELLKKSRLSRHEEDHQKGSCKTSQKLEVKLQKLESDLTTEQSELQMCQEMLEAELIALNQFLLWRKMELGELEDNSEHNLMSN